MKNFLMLSALIFLAACSFNKDSGGSDSQDQRDADNNSKLSAEYEPIKGIYSGFIKQNSNDPTATADDLNIPVEVRVVPVTVSAPGTTASGKPKTSVALYAIMSFLDTTEDDAQFTATYTSEDGNLILAPPQATGTNGNSGTQTTQPAPSDNTTARNYSIEGHVVNNHIIGSVADRTGVLGDIDVVLVSKDPAQQDSFAKKERFEKALAPVLGSFQGVLTLDGGGSMSQMDIVVTVSTDGAIKPSLVASCNSKYFGTSGLAAKYLPRPKPGHLTLSNINGTGSACFIDKLEAYASGDKLIATVTMMKSGAKQQITFNRVKTPTPKKSLH